MYTYTYDLTSQTEEGEGGEGYLQTRRRCGGGDVIGKLYLCMQLAVVVTNMHSLRSILESEKDQQRLVKVLLNQ